MQSFQWPLAGPSKLERSNFRGPSKFRGQYSSLVIWAQDTTPKIVAHCLLVQGWHATVKQRELGHNNNPFSPPGHMQALALRVS